MCITNETSLAMSGQNWCDLLAIDLSVIEEKNDTKAAKHHQNIQAILTPRSEHFPDLRTRSTAGEPVTWQGNNYPPGMLPANHIVRGILWELYHLNFAYELLSLERCACSESNLVRLNDLQLVQRQLMISEFFPVNPSPDHFLNTIMDWPHMTSRNVFHSSSAWFA